MEISYIAHVHFDREAEKALRSAKRVQFGSFCPVARCRHTRLEAGAERSSRAQRSEAGAKPDLTQACDGGQRVARFGRWSREGHCVLCGATICCYLFLGGIPSAWKAVCLPLGRRGVSRGAHHRYPRGASTCPTARMIPTLKHSTCTSCLQPTFAP